MRVAYICDGEGCKSPNKSCREYPRGHACRCYHTTDPAHAVNGACDAPEMEPDRFAQLEPGVFIEIDCECLPMVNKTTARG